MFLHRKGIEALGVVFLALGSLASSFLLYLEGAGSCLKKRANLGNFI